MGDKVRVRFAPSPTGEPHVGNIRTAIFNWLFARHHKGSFIIRVEDTDQARKVDGATEELLDSLRWLGLDWDEGPDVGGSHDPYYQSQRLELYRGEADRLLESGHAYRCYCSPERLAQMREDQTRRKQHPGYDRKCRELGEAEGLAHGQKEVASVVRFRMPLDGVTHLDDLIRGRVSFENGLIDDYVLLKSDGFPTYHLANVVDDHKMQISHVMRAEEWLSSTPRHLQLYHALDWEPPRFAHLPMILAPDKSKLSKRHGATSILDYDRLGYLPEAMVNFLLMLGWSLDDKTEIISQAEAIEHFTMERVGKAGAVFDADKLSWMNGHHLRRLSPDQLAEALLDHWRRYPPQELPELPDPAFLLRIVPLVQERLKTLGDAAPLIPFFFKDEVSYEETELIQKGMDPVTTKQALQSTLDSLCQAGSFEAESTEALVRPLAQELGIKVGQLFGSLRVATTGLRVSPPLFETMEVLGRERTLASIQKAIDRL